MAYLCSAYPWFSHTFVLREVQALRRIGVDVHTFTVRETPSERLLSQIDRSEAARTHHLLPTNAGVLSRSLLRLLGSRRGVRALVSASRRAWSLRRPGARGTLWQLFYLTEAVLLWAECSRRSIRHIHAHFANVSSDVALLAVALGTAQQPDAPWSWSFTMHGPAEFWNAAKHRLADKASSARFVACISEFARSQLMALTLPTVWERFHVVHCGLDFNAYAQTDGRPASEQLRVVTVGRLVPLKGQILVVEMIRALRERGLEVSAEIIGEGPARSDLEQRIAQHSLAGLVTLSGAVGQDVLPDHLRRATVFVLPSFAEGVPVSAMEAMALGVPVVASRIAGIPELIDDGVSGLLATPGRIDELVQATERLLRDPALRGRIAAAGRETVAKAFDVTTESCKLAALFPGQSVPNGLVPVRNADQNREGQ